MQNLLNRLQTIAFFATAAFSVEVHAAIIHESFFEAGPQRQKSRLGDHLALHLPGPPNAAISYNEAATPKREVVRRSMPHSYFSFYLHPPETVVAFGATGWWQQQDTSKNEQFVIATDEPGENVLATGTETQTQLAGSNLLPWCGIFMATFGGLSLLGKFTEDPHNPHPTAFDWLLHPIATRKRRLTLRRRILVWRH